MKSALALTFHRIKEALFHSQTVLDPTADRYAITNGLFQQVVDMIPGERCCTVSEYIEKQDGNWLILTFDDGFLSDFEIVYPILKDKGVKATFFINEKNICLPGYLELSHLKEMTKAGMEIGSHGLTHRYLITMNRVEANQEIRDSKDKLEQEIGTKVASFAPVGGHYNGWMEEFACKAGYRAFATMIPGKTNGGGDFTVLRRNHIQSHHDAKYLSQLIHGDYGTLLLNRLRYNLLQIPKNILGINNYDLFKKYLLGIFKVPY